MEAGLRERDASTFNQRYKASTEVKLYTTNTEREKYGLLATLFGIIVALDYLERAYVRDSVTAAECVFELPCHS